MTLNPVLIVHRFRVKEIKWETAEIFTLVLAPEDTSSRLMFRPGQWVYLHLYNSDGSHWAKAAYSIASGPSESSESMEFGIKVKGDFTQRLSKVMPDDVIGVQGPFGVFVLPEAQRPLVLFAGGIGISPLRSMIHEIMMGEAPRDVTLFYSNKYIEETAYFTEFNQLAKSASWFHFVPILTQSVPSEWAGESGRLSAEMVKKHVSNLDADFSMCGPREFMDAIRAMLAAEGVDVKTRLKQELFG